MKARSSVICLFMLTTVLPAILPPVGVQSLALQAELDTTPEPPSPARDDVSDSSGWQGALANNENLELIGQIGGLITNIAVQGTYAYIAVGPRLVILNLSDPAHPALAGQTGILPENIHGLAVSGGYAYVGNGLAGLRIISIADPANPTEVGFYDTPGFAARLDVAGDHVYVSDTDAGLRIINVSDPAHPTEAGVYETVGPAHDVAVAGDYAYVTDRYIGLHIISVADPAQPTHVGFYDILDDYSREVVVRGNHAYVGTSQNGPGGNLRIIDVADPAQPSEIGFAETCDGVRGLAVIENYAYITDGCQMAMIVHIADPANPWTGCGDAIIWPVSALAVAGDYAYIGDIDGGLHIYSITDPENPVEIGLYRTPGYAYDIAVAGNYAYIGHSSGRLHILNVRDPARPAKVGFYNHPYFPSNGVALEVANDNVYVVEDLGLRIINVTNPAHPVEIAFFDPQDPPFRGWALTLEGDHAYVGQLALHIVDISNPDEPFKVGQTEPIAVGDVAISGDYALVAGGSCINMGLYSINITDPTEPTVVGFHPMRIGRVVVSGTYAYVTDNGGAAGGLHIFDIADPANPVEIGLYRTPGYAYDIAVAGNYVYVADQYTCRVDWYHKGTLRIIDVAEPTNPVEIAAHNTLANLNNLEISGNLVYVADGVGGLLVFWFAPPVSAVIPVGGGTLTSATDGTSYIFPTGTFSQTAVITHTARFPGNAPPTGSLLGIGHVFDVTGVYSATGEPAQPAPGTTYTVTVEYSDDEKGTVVENTLALYYWDGSQWVKDASSAVDTVANKVVATPNHLSLWAVLGETRRVYIPLLLREL